MYQHNGLVTRDIVRPPSLLIPEIIFGIHRALGENQFGFVNFGGHARTLVRAIGLTVRITNLAGAPATLSEQKRTFCLSDG